MDEETRKKLRELRFHLGVAREAGAGREKAKEEKAANRLGGVLNTAGKALQATTGYNIPVPKRFQPTTVLKHRRAAIDDALAQRERKEHIKESNKILRSLKKEE